MTLFNEYEAMTEQAQMVCRRVEQALIPLIADMQEAGASLREVEYLIHTTVAAEIAVRILRQACEKRKAEREAFNAHRPSGTP